MTGLEYEQVLELEDRVEGYLGGWHPERGRRREMELFDAVVATFVLLSAQLQPGGHWRGVRG
jgi:hypothetical protein